MEQSYEEYLEEQESGGKIQSKIFKNFFSKLEFIHYAGIVILILVVNGLVKKGGDNKWVFISLGAVILIWILSLTGKNQDKKPIPRHIAEQISLNDLNRLISINSSYPTGTKAIHTGKFNVLHLDSGDPRGWGLDKYYLGFRVIRPGKSTLYMTYKMNPYPPGDCKGIVETALEWDGTDTVKDFQIIIPEKTIIEEKKSGPSNSN